MFDGKEFGREVVENIRDFVDRSHADLVARIQELERRVETLSETAMVYSGIFSRALAYRRGQAVSHGGSLWLCLYDCQGDVPGSDPSLWLMVAKGSEAPRDRDKPRLAPHSVKLNGTAAS